MLFPYIEKTATNCYRIKNDSGENYLYPPEKIETIRE